MFLSAGRGRHVPAPSGRDVGSSSERAPTQEPVQGADPRTGFYRYPSTYVVVVFLVALVYLVALLLFPSSLLLYFPRVCVSRWFYLPLSLVVTVDAKRFHCADLSAGGFYEISLAGGFYEILSSTLSLVRFGTRDRRVTHSAHLRKLHSVSRHPSFDWP